MVSHGLVVDVKVAMQLGDEVQPHGQLVTAIVTLNVSLIA